MRDSEGNRNIIPILTGPTGAGKSAVVNQILEKFPEINVISADSRQIYRRLDIGTDKPSQEERARYRYHLIDICEPGDRYSAYNFVADAKGIIEGSSRQRLFPLISGGTGLYIRSLVEGIVEIPDNDFTIRSHLENEVVEKGPQYLYERLKVIDPEEAEKIHPNNIRRVIRAIEIYELTGKPKSQIINKEKDEGDEFRYEILALMPPREKLYEAIETRVDRMMKDGLLDEVEGLYKDGLKEKVEEINVIGYNELFQYLDDKISLDAAVNLIKQNTRRFAKRQITWFRGMRNMKSLISQELVYTELIKYYSAAI